MPRGKTVNKSQAIREMFAELGLDTLPKEVVSRLAKRGIKVNGQTVSMIKLRLRQQAAREGKPATGAAPEAPAARPAQRSPGLVDPGSVTSWLTAVKAAKQDLGDDVARQLLELA
jgi:hypothetical protein